VALKYYRKQAAPVVQAERVETDDKILCGANKDSKISTVVALRKFLDEKAQEVGK